MQVHFSIAPEDLHSAAQAGRSFAHMAYHIGEHSTLLRQNLLLQTRGGLLCVTDADAPQVSSPQALAAAVARECDRRGYSGAVLDFEAPLRADLAQTAAQLQALLLPRRKALYLSPAYHKAVPQGIFLISTAISGGNLRACLAEEAARYGGAEHTALDVQRLRMDFSLPARSGNGTPLTAEDFEALMQRERPSVFFSPELCARYFTYTREREIHFVLFDDAQTISKKLHLGTSLGCSAAFLAWPEVRDLAQQLQLP